MAYFPVETIISLVNTVITMTVMIMLLLMMVRLMSAFMKPLAAPSK